MNTTPIRSFISPIFYVETDNLLLKQPIAVVTPTSEFSIVSILNIYTLYILATSSSIIVDTTNMCSTYIFTVFNSIIADTTNICAAYVQFIIETLEISTF